MPQNPLKTTVIADVTTLAAAIRALVEFHDTHVFHTSEEVAEYFKDQLAEVVAESHKLQCSIDVLCRSAEAVSRLEPGTPTPHQ